MSKAEPRRYTWRLWRLRQIVVFAAALSFYPYVIWLLPAAVPRYGMREFYVALALWLALLLVVGWWVATFRCPRCGKYFMFAESWSATWSRSWRYSVRGEARCLNCGLAMWQRWDSDTA